MTAQPRPSSDAARGPGDHARSAPLLPHPTARELVAVALAAAVASWAGYFLFTGMPQFTLHVFPATVTLHAVAGGGAIVLLASLLLARRPPGGTPLDLALFAVVAAFAVATLTSVNWRVSVEWMLMAAVGVIAFYVFASLPLLSAQLLRWIAATLAAALSFYALWVVGNDYADYLRLVNDIEGLRAGNIFPPTVPRVRDVSDHPNVLAMLLALFLPFLLLPALRPRLRVERPLALLALFAMGWALFLTLSRGAWAGAAAALLFSLAASWLTARLWEREQSGERPTWDTYLPRQLTPTALATILGALALAVFGALGFLASLETRPGWLFRGSLSPREDAWDAAWTIFGDDPLTGAGPHTFGLLYPEISGRFIVHTQHAHNALLQVATDAGLLGLAAVAVAITVLVYMLWRTWRVGSLQQRLLAVACGGGLLGFSVHNMVDAANSWKAPLVALALVAAIVARNYVEAGAAHQPSGHMPAWARQTMRWAAAAAAVALLLAPLAGWYRIDRPHHEYWRGVELMNDRDEPDWLASATRSLQRAVNRDSSMMVYQMQLGVAQAMLYEAGGFDDAFLIQAATIHFERAVELDPRSDIAHANLARAYQLQHRDDAAAEQARIARRSAYHVTPVLVAGEVFEALGLHDDAISTYGQSLSMDAGLANSAFWETTAFRRDRFDEILRASVIGLNPCTYGAFLVEAQRFGGARAGETLDEALADCETLAFAAPDDLFVRVNLAKMLLDSGDAPAARVHLDAAVVRQPDFAQARTELGRWYAAQGDVDSARAQWLRGAELGDAESAWLLIGTYDTGELPAGLRDRLEDLLLTSGSSVQNDLISVLYFRMRYSRLSPVLPLIPGDWSAAVPRPYAAMRETLARLDDADPEGR